MHDFFHHLFTSTFIVHMVGHHISTSTLIVHMVGISMLDHKSMIACHQQLPNDVHRDTCSKNHCWYEPCKHWIIIRSLSMSSKRAVCHCTKSTLFFKYQVAKGFAPLSTLFVFGYLSPYGHRNVGFHLGAISYTEIFYLLVLLISQMLPIDESKFEHYIYIYICPSEP